MSRYSIGPILAQVSPLLLSASFASMLHRNMNIDRVLSSLSISLDTQYKMQNATQAKAKYPVLSSLLFYRIRLQSINVPG